MGKRRYREPDEDEDRPHGRRRKGGGSRAPLVITLVALLLGILGGGGFLGYWWFAVRPKEQLQKNRERLVGKWSALVRESDRRVAVFEFRQDGGFTLSMSDAAGHRVSSSGTWKVLGGKGTIIRVQMTTELADRSKDIEMVSRDRFRYTSEKGVVYDARRVP